MAIDRRSFLQGFMAVAGIAAVGLPVSSVAEGARIEVSAPFATQGEIWVKLADRWELLGVATTVTISREPELDFRDTEGYAHFIPSKETVLRVALLSDAGGLAKINDIFTSGSALPCRIGSFAGSIAGSAVLTEWTWRGERGRARLGELEFVFDGGMHISKA